MGVLDSVTLKLFDIVTSLLGVRDCVTELVSSRLTVEDSELVMLLERLLLRERVSSDECVFVGVRIVVRVGVRI